MGRGGVGSSRSEFLAEDSLADDIRYHRNGGCFVTTKRALLFILVALVSLLCVIVLMYYYGPNRQLEVLKDENKDIEQLLNKTINDEPNEDIRLPPNLKPINYRLKIFPMLDEHHPLNFTYTGHVTITVRCVAKTNKIVLNVDGLTVSAANVSVSAVRVPAPPPAGNETSAAEGARNATEPEEVRRVAVQEVYGEPAMHKLVIVVRSALETGRNYTVDLRFSANITNNLAGFYRTSYKTEQGATRWLATTYLQPIFARRVFPCFDEPNFKAPFEISIARRTNMTALSNMPIRETEPIAESPGWVWDHFDASLPMSTHLVAFTVCDFHRLRSTGAAAPALSIWAPAGDLARARYALEAAGSILLFLEEYLDIGYPLPKIDLLAIPNFARGAMGSWGVLSFRRAAILVEEQSRNWEAKQAIFIALAHEMAHQWFGNLVTMRWWNDLWLNEGIGSFMAEVVQTTLKPKWQASNDFPLRVMYKSFSLDSLKSTHAIQTAVTKTVQIEQIFDTIIQSKGTSLIRMLNYTLTKPIFRKGLQNYLKSLSYKTSDQQTLWQTLNTAAANTSALPPNVTVQAFMESWTQQKGYPYVTISRNYATGEANVSQEIFIQDNVNNATLWHIPLTYSLTDDSMRRVWLPGVRNMTINVTSAGNATSWVLFNIDQSGYYRVNYDTQNWRLLIAQLRSDPAEIPIASRGQLIDDAFELAQLGIINYTIPLALCKYLRLKEANYIPWQTALNSLDEIRFIINNYEYTGAYRTFITNLIRAKFDALGTAEKANEGQNNRILRLRLMKVACEVRYEPCLRWARGQFEAWMEQADPDATNPIALEYRPIVQCVGIKAGGIRDWDFLWNRTLSPHISPSDLKTAYLSLGCTHDPWLINRYLEMSLQGNVTLEYIPYVWQSINHLVGIRTGFHFFRLNWNKIYAIYEDVYLVLSAICQDFLAYLSTEIDLQDLTQFYKLHQKDLKPIASLMQATVDSIKLRISWREKYLDSVVDWLKHNKI